MVRARNWRNATLAVAASLFIVLLSACGGGSSSASGGTASTVVHGGTLTLARAEDPASFDPIVPSDNGSIWTMLLIYGQLVRVNSAGTGVSADLAKSWDVSNSGTTYTFHLRPGVTFSNGMPLTSSDVKFSLERAFKSANWSFLFTSVKSIQVPSTDTVVITLNKPDAALLSKLALYGASIIPEKVYKGAKESKFDHPIGTGPFMLQSWVKGKKEVLAANPHYWQKPYPYLSKVVLEDIANDNTRLLLARSGRADVVTEIPYTDLKTLSQDKKLTVKTYPVGRVDMVLMNDKKKPFNDINVRKAINYAIDRKALIKSVLEGYGTRANAFLPPMLYNCPASVCPGYQYNLKEAKAYMAKSSVPNGFTTTLNIVSGLQFAKEDAVIIKQELAKIGITVNIVPGDHATLSSLAQKGNYDMEKRYMTTDIIDPSELTQFAGVGNGGTYSFFTYWDNQQLDQLATQVNATTDKAKRKQMYDEIQKIFNQGAPVVDLYYPPTVGAYQNYVHGFKVLETGNYQLWKVWMSKH